MVEVFGLGVEFYVGLGCFLVRNGNGDGFLASLTFEFEELVYSLFVFRVDSCTIAGFGGVDDEAAFLDGFDGFLDGFFLAGVF